MSKPRTLPARSARTMLLPVLASIGLSKLCRVSRRLCAFVATALLTAAPALAQVPTDDSGWFDPPTGGPADPAPAPHAAAPSRATAEAAPAAPAADAEDTDPSALTTFRPALDPYGTWVADPQYGTVWVPSRAAVGDDFAPYVSRGHWALTADDDWIWVSDYPFGWAVFHYGRWVWISGSGWAWVPGRRYANAWVVWRVPTAGYAYVGWAPMPPSWVWMHGHAVTLWYGPPLPYVFCSSSYVFHRHVHRHIVRDRDHVHRIASHTSIYPTPYRVPAQPSRHAAATPSVRPPPAPSAAPRGPRIAAARIPADAIPTRRAAPPIEATRLAPPPAIGTADVASRRSPESELRARVPVRDARTRLPEREMRAPAPERATRARVPEPARSSPSSRPVSRETERPSAAPAPRARTTAPERLRDQPRSPAPTRVRPPATSRDLGPARRTRRP